LNQCFSLASLARGEFVFFLRFPNRELGESLAKSFRLPSKPGLIKRNKLHRLGEVIFQWGAVGDHFKVAFNDDRGFSAFG